MSEYSRGRLILSLLQFNNNKLNINTDEEDPVSSVSKESSPATSLTELRALDPEFVNNILSEDFELIGRDNPDQHNKDLFKLCVKDQLEEHAEVHFKYEDTHFEHEKSHIFDPGAENQILLMLTQS